MRELVYKASRFVRLVTPSHIETLDAWCEHTGKSAPKSIVKAIELARKYEQEMPALLDELRVWKLAFEHKQFYYDKGDKA